MCVMYFCIIQYAKKGHSTTNAMGLAKNTISQTVTFQSQQTLNGWHPGVEAEIRYTGSARFDLDEKGNELDCTILEVEVSISGSRWRKISLPADQEQCGTDMQMFLAHMRQAARHAIWVENTLQAEHQWCFQRMPERAEMSEA